jgi:hypothetical protein
MKKDDVIVGILVLLLFLILSGLMFVQLNFCQTFFPEQKFTCAFSGNFKIMEIQDEKRRN